MILEATLVVAGRGIPFLSLSVPKGEIKGRQRVLELSLEYALAAMGRPGQLLYILVDRGFAGLDYLGPSELYPWMRRITRLKATMILHWDSVSAPLQEWPLYEGEVVEIPQCLLGRKKQVLCGAVLAHVGATCYLACHPDDVGDVLSFYQKRVWIEEQNRDIKTGFKGRVMRFLLLPLFDKLLLRKRSICETINDQLKNSSQIEHSRHRSPFNFFVNMIAGLVAYTFREKKPSLNIRLHPALPTVVL